MQESSNVDHLIEQIVTEARSKGVSGGHLDDHPSFNLQRDGRSGLDCRPFASAMHNLDSGPHRLFLNGFAHDENGSIDGRPRLFLPLQITNRDLDRLGVPPSGERDGKCPRPFFGNIGNPHIVVPQCSQGSLDDLLIHAKLPGFAHEPHPHDYHSPAATAETRSFK